MYAKEKTAQTRKRVHVKCVGSRLIGPSRCGEQSDRSLQLQ